MKRSFIIILTPFLLGVLISQFFYSNYGQKRVIEREESLDMRQFWEVYDIVKEEYFSTKEVHKNKLIEGAISGMIEALGDEHSEFMNPETTEKFHSALQGDFEGIGAVVEKVPLGVKVERILKGSPAKKYDVRAGDIIISANNHSLEDLDIYDAVEKIKGPAKTEVILDILRVGEEKIISKTLIREKIHIPSVEKEEINAKTSYISLNMYGESSVEEFQKAILQVIDSGKTGLILDLRDNGGGYLQSAVEILSYFIGEGSLLVETRYRKSHLGEKYYALDMGEQFTGKVVVLINNNSASASEITAGALREYNKAILVGEQSYGKGSVQIPFEFNGGSLLKLTVAKWFTAQGKNIEESGIEPDIEIEFTEEDFENQYDRQLEESKKILEIFREEETIGMSIEKYKESIASE